MLTLKLPMLADMPFRQGCMADPATMAYNRGYASWDGYDPATGCIAFPESEWQPWLADWTSNAPERFFAFLQNDAGQLVGEVNWHDYGRSMGVIVAAEQRGHHYGAEGLKLLAAKAFSFPEVMALCNDVPEDRSAAIAAHEAAGFARIGTKDGCTLLRLTRERYEDLRREQLLRRLREAMLVHDGGDPRRVQHFIKVHAFARHIAIEEGLTGDALWTLEAAALTHDIGIRPAEQKYGSCAGPLQEQEGPAPAQAMMGALGFPEEVIQRVCFLIAHHHHVTNVKGLDWRILLEADALVNLFEDSVSLDAVRRSLETVFRTETGARLCREMFALA